MSDARAAHDGSAAARPLPARGPARLLAAVRRRLRWWLHALRWRPRFARFGPRSLLSRPAMLSGTRAIAIGSGVEIRPGARLEAFDVEDAATPRLVIGDGTSIHLHFHCGAARRVEIGRDVLVAGHVYVTDHDHDLGRPGSPPRTHGRLVAAPTVVGDDCWLGEGCKILKGVELGRGCVVAAGAVVTRSAEPYTLLAGVPARPLKRWDEETRTWAPVRP